MAQQAILEPELASIFADHVPFQLPNSVRNSLVHYLPYVLALLLPLSLLILVFSGGLALLDGFALHLKSSLSLLVGALSLVWGMLALPGLFRRTRRGWATLYRAELLYCLSALIGTDLGGLLLVFVLGFYLLFQIRTHYA